jgi:hypothetical protein
MGREQRQGFSWLAPFNILQHSAGTYCSWGLKVPSRCPLKVPLKVPAEYRCRKVPAEYWSAGGKNNALPTRLAHRRA